MRRWLLGIILFSSCGSAVPPGYVGLIVNLYGSEKGVSERAVPTGRYWVGWNEQLFLFPTFTQNYVWSKSPHEGSPQDESITFQTKEGLSANGDFGITYSITADKVPAVFQKYRRGVEEITDTFLRNIVRDGLNSSASGMSVEDIYGTGKQKLMVTVTEIAQKEVGPLGITVEKVYLIGEFRLPEVVTKAINEKINATQKAMQIENEVAQAKAEASKRLIQAQAESDANLKIAKSLTTEYINYLKVQKWDGKVPQVEGGSTPMISLK